MNKFANTLKFIQENGVGGFRKECYHRLTDAYYEKHFHVHTRGSVSKDRLGINNGDSRGYSSVHYRQIIEMLDKVPLDHDERVLLDYGCGKGRVIVTAAARDYKWILGVELSDLIYDAKHNIERMRHRRTNHIGLIQCDAGDFTVPADVNIIYFFSPFAGSLLEKVTGNIYASYRAAPRKIYIVYFNNDHFDRVIAHQDWLTKIYQSSLHPRNTCGLYVTRP